MKIYPHSSPTITEQQDDRKARKATGDQFADLLQGEIERSAPQRTDTSGATSAVPSVSGLLPIQEAQAVNGFSSGQEIMDKVDALLDQWESYARDLKAQPLDLKTAYARLQSIFQNVREMKEGMPDQAAPEQLRSMVEEMDILAVTEEIRINRGDYTPKF